MYDGTRTVFALLMRLRRIDCLIHQVAYVEKRQPAAGSNFSTAFRSPRFPSSMRSRKPSPRLT
jgi:hypothetical protein